jgi:hypothetical protein
MTEARVTQTPVEALTQPAAAAQLTQALVEVLGTLVATVSEARISHALVEVLSVLPIPARVTHAVLEVLTDPNLSPTFFIDGLNETPRVRATSTMDVTYTLGNRTVARFETVDIYEDSTVTAYAPELDLPVELRHRGVVLFTGSIFEKRIGALGEPAKRILAGLTAASKAEVFDRRLVSETYLMTDSWTLKTIVSDLVSTYAAINGITADPGMATGPALDADLRYDRIPLQQVLRDLAAMSGWIFRLTPANVLEFFAVGTKTASFSLSTATGAILGGVNWSKARTRYVNRVIVRIGGTQQAQIPMTWYGDGVTEIFPLPFPPVLNPDASGEQPEGVLDAQPVVEEQPGNHYLALYHPEGYDYDPDTNSLVRLGYVGVPPDPDALGPLPIGTTATWWYKAQFPYDVIVEDAADIAINGPWEELIERPDLFSIAEATAIGEGILAQSRTTARVLTIRTRNRPAFAGDTITLDIPEREAVDQWLITAVSIRQWSNDDLEYTFTCLEGDVTRESWQDYLRNLWGARRTATLPAQPAISGAVARIRQAPLFRRRP